MEPALDLASGNTRRSGFWPRTLAIASCALLASCGEKMVPASVGDTTT